MSAFIGAPAGPHIGQCQNFILVGERGHYCLAPVLGLGGELKTDRDICGACRMRTEAFATRSIERFVAGLDAAGAKTWVELTRELLAGSDQWLYRRAAERAPMDELFRIRKDIALRELILDTVLAAFPPLDTSQPLL